MSLLTVVNRHEVPFVGMWDGQEYVVSDRLTVTDLIDWHLKKQSIISDNPIVPGDNVYRLGILENDDDLSPLEAVLPVESLDRRDFDEFQKVRLMPSGIRTSRPEPKTTVTNSSTISK